MSYARAALLLMLAAGCSKQPVFKTGLIDMAPATPSGPGAATGADLGAGGASDLAPSGPQPTTIRVHYPAGSHTLALRGDSDGLNWATGVTLTAAGPDTWSYTLPMPSAPVQWKPLLDDSTWSRGPNYVVQPGQTVDVYPHFVNANGQVVKLIAPFHSTVLNNDRTIWAYLPASYAENTDAHYPVLYMHDGQNLFDPALAFGGNDWKVENTLDAADEDGSIEELIVIGVENTAQRIYEYTPTTDPSTAGGGGGDLYLQLLINELKPQVDSMLRTLPDRAHTGILGSSLGGLISAYAGVKRPDVYGIVGAMSPSTWWNNDVIVGDVGGMPSAMRPARVYVDSGDTQSADDVNDTNLLAAKFLAIGYSAGTNFDHVVQAGGQHNEIYWAMRLPGALQFLFGPRTP
jgi:predicted alpha/beta superfamily hydrolase